MSAAKNRIKAKLPLLPYDGPGTAPGKFKDRDDWAQWMEREHIGRFAAFDHAQHGRAYGRCTRCAYVGEDDAHGLPDFDVTVESLRTHDAVTVRLVAARVHFYTTEDDAKSDALLRLERVKEGEG